MPISLGTTTVTALYLGTTSITSAYLGSTQVFGGSFTPLSLFSGGAQGIWLDPSDLSTMFSDRAGTTPVTTPGTVVGLRLDKSKGLALGSELVVNGDFATASDWTLGTGASISGGVLAYAGGTSGTTSQPTVNQSGKTYVVTFTIVSRSAGAVRVRFAANSDGALQTAPGTFTLYTKSLSNNSDILVETNSAFVGSIDNISVRELAGNHATAPTDAARPVYGVEPKGGRRNLLTWSEDFGNAAWIKSGATVTSNQTTNPLGTVTDADKVDGTGANGGVYATGSGNVLSGVDATISVWVKSATGSNQTIRFRGQTGAGANVFSPDITATSSWQRVSFTWTPSSTFPPTPGILTDASGTAFSVFLWGAQLEIAATVTAYQRVTTAYDVTESGVATTHYVQYDGSDDSMSTAAIDFTATDKMSVFAGARAIGSSEAILAELSANAGSNNGSFALSAPSYVGSGSHLFGSKGTIFALAPSANTFPPPRSSVLTGLGDISGDRATLRINGSQVAQVTTDQGTGNFGNYPMFFGRRNNATLPFNGKDYGIIVVGKAASAGEITDTETWLAAKTSGVSL